MTVARILGVHEWPMPPAYTRGVAQAIRARIERANRAVRRKGPVDPLHGFHARFGYCAACWLVQAQCEEVSA